MSDLHSGLFTIDAANYQRREPDVQVEAVGDGVWTVSDGDHRTIFARGREGVVAVNTFGTPGAARAYRRAIERTVSRARIETVVCTIDHLDHAGYAADLAPEAERVGHELTATVIKGRGADGQLALTRLVRGDGEELDLNGVRVGLRYSGPTVGTGNLAVYLPDQRLLFMVGPRADARYGLFPDFHLRHCVANVRALLELEIDRFIPGRSRPMSAHEVARACDYLESLKEASQRAFAEGVPIWEYEPMEHYVAAALRERFGSLEGFDRHVGIGAIRVVHHYLMGGWGLEDATEPERLLAAAERG
jgi:glyoxylase-like metal-dependent hydrolase (beta-lactamase superfamily II)